MNIQNTITHVKVDDRGNVTMVGKFRVGDLRRQDWTKVCGIDRVE